MFRTIEKWYGFPHDFTWSRTRSLGFWKVVFICSWLGHQVNVKGDLWCSRCGLYYGEFANMKNMGVSVKAEELQAEKQDITAMLNHNAGRIVELEIAINTVLGHLRTDAFMECSIAEHCEEVLEKALKGEP